MEKEKPKQSKPIHVPDTDGYINGFLIIQDVDKTKDIYINNDKNDKGKRVG